MCPISNRGHVLIWRQLAAAFIANVRRYKAYSPRVALHVTFTMVSRRALCQVLQRLLSRLIECRFLDALLPLASVFAAEIRQPLSDSSNLCQNGALMCPTSQLDRLV
jgi:hypothetical protein